MSSEAPRQDPPQAEKSKITIALILGLAVISLGLLCALFYLTGFGEDEPTNRIDPAEAQMDRLRVVLIQYKFLQGRLPTTEQGLKVLVEPPPTAAVQRKLVESAAIVDPWGHPYHYRKNETVIGRPFEIWSLGKDGLDGTADDVRNE